MIIEKMKEHPNYGTIEYDGNGNPICHICGQGYSKVLTHVWQKHGLSGNEYKEMFGLDKKKGIVSQEVKEKLQESVSKHYDLVVAKNLIAKGNKTRFNSGHEGRTKDKISEQTSRRLKVHFKNIGYSRGVNND